MLEPEAPPEAFVDRNIEANVDIRDVRCELTHCVAALMTVVLEWMHRREAAKTQRRLLKLPIAIGNAQ